MKGIVYMRITVESTEDTIRHYSSEDESRQRDWYRRPKKVLLWTSRATDRHFRRQEDLGQIEPGRHDIGPRDDLPVFGECTLRY